MFEIYQTPLDVLYLVLSISAGVVAFFLMLALVQLIGLLRNVRKISEKTRDTVDLVNHYLWTPIKIMLMVMEKGKEYASKHSKKK